MRLDADGYLIVCDTALGMFKINVATGIWSSAQLCHSAFSFLLLARYVPNVAKRSTWDQCKNKYKLILRTDQRRTDDWLTDLSRLSLGKISNGHISARGRPIHFMFGSVVGFSGTGIEWHYFRFRQIGRHLGNFKLRYLRGGSSDLLRVWFQDGVFVVGGSNGAISGFAKSKMSRHVGKFKRQYLCGGSSDLLRVWFQVHVWTDEDWGIEDIQRFQPQIFGVHTARSKVRDRAVWYWDVSTAVLC